MLCYFLSVILLLHDCYIIDITSLRKHKSGKEYLDCFVVFWNHFAFPLVVDTYFLQPPIATSGETAFSSGVLKGKLGFVGALLDRVFPYANNVLSKFLS
jgi:hypothetical protein